MLEPDDANGEEISSGNRWPLIYAVVMANTVLVILLIYLFFRHYAA